MTITTIPREDQVEVVGDKTILVMKDQANLMEVNLLMQSVTRYLTELDEKL